MKLLLTATEIVLGERGGGVGGGGGGCGGIDYHGFHYIKH